MKFHRVHFLKMLFLCLSLFYFVKTFSKPDDNLKITGTYNESFVDFLNEIGKANNTIFYFQTDWFKSKIVNKTFENTSLTTILEDLLHDLPYKFYFIQSNIIVFLPKDDVLNILGKSSFQTTESDNNIQPFRTS